MRWTTWWRCNPPLGGVPPAGGLVAVELSRGAGAGLSHLAPSVRHCRWVGAAIPEQHLKLAGGQPHRGAGCPWPPRQPSGREALGAASKRQNTLPAEKHGGQVTILDPAHPLYGRTVTVLRVHSARSQARLVVRLPDGRVRWIPRAITDLDPSPPVPPPVALISAPTLLPLARLLCAMVSAQEDSHYDSTDRSLVTETGSPADAFPTSALVDGVSAGHPPATGPLCVRLDPAVPGRRGHGGPGEAS